MRRYEMYIRYLIDYGNKFGGDTEINCRIELERVILKLTGIENYYDAYDYLTDIKGYKI